MPIEDLPHQPDSLPGRYIRQANHAAVLATFSEDERRKVPIQSHDDPLFVGGYLKELWIPRIRS